MYSVLHHANDKQASKKLDGALANTRLIYSSHPPPEKETGEQRRFRKRMDRLRLRAEEARYVKLTKNLDTHVEDDVTTKSMTYAASVGLNMIVAPISFGVFMYFFAGAIFGWMTGNDEELKPHQTDIKSVFTGELSVVCTTGALSRFLIILLYNATNSIYVYSWDAKGVISGVGMLFVEMILFVIRTHEFDAVVTKKKRKRATTISPFGYSCEPKQKAK
jgi:hypothetical protein